MNYVKLLYRRTLYISHDIVKRFSDVETKKQKKRYNRELIFPPQVNQSGHCLPLRPSALATSWEDIKVTRWHAL